MPTISVSERRQNLRNLLQTPAVTSPAPVFDAASARLAGAAGFRCLLLPGSIASHVAIGSPDLVIITLSELVDYTWRITRGSDLPLIVDADHGYGNAFNVTRTVQDLETIGVAGITIEDTLLPRAYGGPGGPGAEIVGRDEFAAKLRAAVAARRDPSFVIIARTEAIPFGEEEALARVKLAADAGVDAVFPRGVKDLAQLQRVHAASPLPIVLNSEPAAMPDLVANGVRLIFQGALPYFVALQALYDAYAHLAAGGKPEGLNERVLTPELRKIAMYEDGYALQAKEYLGGDGKSFRS
jgi:carboxyvinyl-carboxyphosphonate phosphorylmutase